MNPEKTFDGESSFSAQQSVLIAFPCLFSVVMIVCSYVRLFVSFSEYGKSILNPFWVSPVDSQDKWIFPGCFGVFLPFFGTKCKERDKHTHTEKERLMNLNDFRMCGNSKFRSIFGYRLIVKVPEIILISCVKIKRQEFNFLREKRRRCCFVARD